jgi:hypothetical protein
VTPRRAFEIAVHAAACTSIGPRRPGWLLARLPSDVREALGRLTAEDTQHRVDAVRDVIPADEGQS